jgi:argininosuccinate synthase
LGKTQYSINKGLWGQASSNQPLPSETYPSQLQRRREEKCSIQFEKEVVGVNRKDKPAKNIM